MSQACYTYHPPAANSTHSGINVLGEIPWGSHFCQFYENTQDLLDILVFYFMEGLSNNEVCYWISADEAKQAIVYQSLRKSVAGLDELIAQGKMYFIIRTQLLPDYSQESTKRLLSTLLENEKKLLEQGFSGIRAAGTPEVFASQDEWEQFLVFEATVSATIENHKIIALCCYSLEHHNSLALLSIIKNHEFSLIRCQNNWELLEKSSINATKNQLHKINRELELRVYERTENLLTALHVRDQFLAIASHELKTPIAALRLYADGLLLQQSPDFGLPDKTKIALKRIQEQSQDLEILLNNLLDVTGFQKEGLLAIHSAPLNLAELVRVVISDVNAKFSSQESLISLKTPEILMGQWDGLRLRQVIKNLIENALKYSSNQPIHVTLIQKNNYVSLSVKDQGIGIAKVHHAEIFERFVQLGNKKFVDGFGLGLWIVRQIVEAHNGLITVKSDLGQGAEFTVTLPLQ